jgi:hypothetical protein
MEKSKGEGKEYFFLKPKNLFIAGVAIAALSLIA